MAFRISDSMIFQNAIQQAQLNRSELSRLQEQVSSGKRLLSLGDFMDSLAGTLGAEVQSARRAVLQEGLVVATLEERRGSLSGVSIDEEVTNLIRYQRAYQAAARVISIADDLMEQLLSL